jgi:hypothetical protein
MIGSSPSLAFPVRCIGVPRVLTVIDRNRQVRRNGSRNVKLSDYEDASIGLAMLVYVLETDLYSVSQCVRVIVCCRDLGKVCPNVFNSSG